MKMTKQEEAYVPSAAGLLKFREERSKIVLHPKQMYFFILAFATTILILHLLL